MARESQVRASIWGVLSPDLLMRVAGRPVRAPVSLLHTGAPGMEQDKRLLFLAETGARHPFAVVKWARGAGITSLEDEVANLKIVRGYGDPALAVTCPVCWGPFDVGGDSAILIQRCLPGLPAYAQLRSSVWPRSFVPGHFTAVQEWLPHFSTVTRRPAQPFDESLLDRYIAQPLEAAALHFGDSAVSPECLKSVYSAARACIGQPTRLAAEHGDLWVANLLFSRSAPGLRREPWAGAGNPARLHVVDWEHFAAEALPGFDMLFFCVTYAVHFPWKPFGWEREEVAFYRALLGHTWLTEHIERLLTAVCAATDLPRALVPVMLPVMLARMALRQTERLGESAPKSSWLDMLQSWWNRPRDNWLENWAAKTGS